jgi:Tol biopolymer transport system component
VSADGTQVAFDRSGQVWVMRIDGSAQRMVTSDGFDPSWSPDRTRLAFARSTPSAARGMAPDVFVIRADGTGELNLTAGDQGVEVGVDWSPDGKQDRLRRRRDDYRDEPRRSRQAGVEAGRVP